MLTLRSVKKTRVFRCPLPSFDFCATNQRYSSFLAPLPSQSLHELRATDVVLAFKQWFKSRQSTTLYPSMDKIYEILTRTDDASKIDLELSNLNLHLHEKFVLDVLNHEKDVLSSLKFFDWVGRQSGFVHTRGTFYAIFKILSRAKLMSLMTEFLDSYKNDTAIHKSRFYNTLVMGYAVAGKVEVALRLFGKMRFNGLDLDDFSYHVLLNALVDQNCFDGFNMVAKQIEFRGLQNNITHAVFVKGLCKQQELDRAESYTRALVRSGMEVNEHVIGTLVAGFCKNNQFTKAGKLVEEFGRSGKVPMQAAYTVWIRNLVQTGQLGLALEFLQKNKEMANYIPDLFHYNTLIRKLLRKNRLEEVFDLLMEMNERELGPDEVTMQCVFCFFCKAGMVDVALQLFDSRVEFGFSPSSMAYDFLISTLSGNGSTDEAYRVLRNSVDQGYFPGHKTYSILVDALCREGNVDKMKELVLLALEQNRMPSDSIHNKIISALCKANRVEDAYLIHGQLKQLDRVSSRSAYLSLIEGFSKSNKGDIAARLLIEMQEIGHSPGRKAIEPVIQCLFEMNNSEQHFFRLLDIQLSRHGANADIYNTFIYGAGLARRPELARKAYDMMRNSGIIPNLSSDLVMLRSYLKNEKIASAVIFFNYLSEKRVIGRKICQSMIVGLCEINKPDIALGLFKEMKRNRVKPSIQCYEELVQVLCNNNRYDAAVNIVDDLIREGRSVSTFIGNVLLLHCFKTENLHYYWVQSRHTTTSYSWALGELLRAFSPYISDNPDIEDLEEVIKKIFPPDIYTHNLLIRRVIMSKRIPNAYRMENACTLFGRLRHKGYEPNKWTFDHIVHSFAKFGMKSEAKRWGQEMLRRGFEPTSCTKYYLDRLF